MQINLEELACLEQKQNSVSLKATEGFQAPCSSKLGWDDDGESIDLWLKEQVTAPRRVQP